MDTNTPKSTDGMLLGPAIAYGRVNCGLDYGYEQPVSVNSTSHHTTITYKLSLTLASLFQYVCLSTDRVDSKDQLLELMFKHWKLPHPNLVVSVVGGAKRFKFSKTRISTLFKQGLIDIATTTGKRKHSPY